LQAKELEKVKSMLQRTERENSTKDTLLSQLEQKNTQLQQSGKFST
jgi:hypothetical protein